MADIDQHVIVVVPESHVKGNAGDIWGGIAGQLDPLTTKLEVKEKYLIYHN